MDFHSSPEGRQSLLFLPYISSLRAFARIADSARVLPPYQRDMLPASCRSWLKCHLLREAFGNHAFRISTGPPPEHSSSAFPAFFLSSYNPLPLCIVLPLLLVYRLHKDKDFCFQKGFRHLGDSQQILVEDKINVILP